MLHYYVSLSPNRTTGCNPTNAHTLPRTRPRPPRTTSVSGRSSAIPDTNPHSPRTSLTKLRHATVSLGRFYIDEWRFVHAPLVREWLENLPATGYTSNVCGRSVTLNQASIDRIFGFPDVLLDIRRGNPNSDEHQTLIGIISGPDAEYHEKQGYMVSKFNTEINKIRVKGILQTLLMLKKVDAAPLFLIENLAKALNGHAIAWGDIFFKAVTNDVDKIRKGTTPHTCVGGVITVLIRQQLGPWSLADTKEMGRWITSDDDEDDRTPSPRSLPVPGPVSRLIGITFDQPHGQQSEVSPTTRSLGIQADLLDTAVTTLHD